MAGSGAFRFVIIAVGLICATACGSGESGGSPKSETSPTLRRAVDAANRRYGPEWHCDGVTTNRTTFVECQAPGADSFKVDQFRIVAGVALYWNGLRVSPTPLFVPLIERFYENRGARRATCRVTRRSLPYAFRCRLDGARREARVTVNLHGQMTLYGTTPHQRIGTTVFGLGVP
jgi:hypothetical protein